MWSKGGMDLLSKCSAEQLSKIVHGVLDGICDRRQPTFSDFSENFALEEWWQVKDEIRNFALTYCRNGLSREQALQHLAKLPAKHQEVVLDALVVRSNDLRHAYMNGTNSVSQAALKDFDWKIQLALASDKVATIYQPLVTLDLDIDECGSNRSTSIEMNPDEMKKLVAALDGANRALMQLKTS